MSKKPIDKPTFETITTFERSSDKKLIKYMRVSELAKNLKISDRTARNWIKIGYLKDPIFDSNAWYIPVTEFEKTLVEDWPSTKPGRDKPYVSPYRKNAKE